MRRLLFVGMLVLSAACWMTAGPGGLLMREVLGCPDPAMHHHHHHHGSDADRGPCVCTGMMSVSDLAVSDTLTVSPTAGPEIVAQVTPQAEPLGTPAPASRTLTPPTPPPNSRA